MASSSTMNFWIIFGLFVWAHLAYSLYPLPYQRADDIRIQAEEAFKNSNELAEQGVKKDRYMNWSKSEWEQELTNSYQYLWVVNFILFVIGILSTFFHYKKYKFWPYYLCLASIIIFNYCFISTWQRLEDPITGFIEFANHIITNHEYVHIYWSIIWPIFVIVLFIFSIQTIFTNAIKNAA